MIAVNDMAHGLLDAQAQQLGGTPVNADIEPAASTTNPSPAPSPSSATRAKARAAKVTHSPDPSSKAASSGPDQRSWSGPDQSPASGSSSQSPAGGSSSQSQAGTLLVSSAGSVMATCESAGAYLLYWSPDQGYAAEDVYRGPAAIASVLFRSLAGGGVVMRVSCSGGTPVAQSYPASDSPEPSGSPGE
jgi:hypothetical protein